MALLGALIPAAHADFTLGPLNVTVWNGPCTGGYFCTSGVGWDALLPPPPVSPIASFTYTGPIDFVNNTPLGGDNSFALFFGSLVSDTSPYVSSYSGSGAASTLDGLLALQMSTEGETNGATNTYIELTGTYSGTGPIIITSDDGSSLYLNGSSTPFLSMAGPQTKHTVSGIMPAPTTGEFDLVYVETNGAPADLIVATPEPSMFLFLGTGLLGLAMLVYHRRFRSRLFRSSL